VPNLVFDIQKRTLWLEPPCDRDQPEDFSDWVLERRDSVSKPNRPWVVRQVLPGGSADLAGAQVGDRILKFGGLDAILEISTFAPSADAGTSGLVLNRTHEHFSGQKL